MSIPDLKGLLETAQRIQSEVARVREELARKTVEGETGGGLCRCTANGKGEILSLTIDPADRGGDKKMIEDLAVGAVNLALDARARAGPGRAVAGDRRAAAAARAVRGLSAMFASPIARLVQQLGKLPGIGEKTAARLAFHILRASPEDAAALAAAIAEVKQKIRFCSVCCDLTEADPCAICRDARRDAGIVCVVAQPQDVVAIERTGGYRGRYHVLHGVLSPLDGIGPDDLRVAELVARGAQAPTAAESSGGHPGDQPQRRGEATAVYLAKLLRPLGVRATPHRHRRPHRRRAGVRRPG